MTTTTRLIPLLIGALLALALTTAGRPATPNSPDATQRPFQPIEQPTPTFDTSAACLPLQAERPAAEHIVVADVYYESHRIEVQHRLRYANRTGGPLEQVVLNVEANRWQDVFTLESVSIDGIPVETTLDGKQLTLPLPNPLPPNCALNATLDFTLNVPRVRGGAYGYKGYLGHTDRQINLGHWLPTVAPRHAESWVSHTPSLVGEQEVLDTADWQVTLHVVNGPDYVTLAAPGEIERLAPGSWRATHLNAREFSASLSGQFRKSTRTLDSGVTVELYTFEGTAQAAVDHVLKVTSESVTAFSEVYGPYQGERLLVVQGDFPDGMEFAGLVFVSDDWFTRWNGKAASYLTLIPVHEVAHQWWYARVGSDPAMTPWLDEALATYSEYIYLETYYPELKQWWWDFRVNHYTPRGPVDGTVYDFNSIRAYINAVYLRGGRMMHSLRNDLGTDAFFNLLARHAQQHRGDIVTSSDFWSLLTPEQLELTQLTRERYFQQPRVDLP